LIIVFSLSERQKIYILLPKNSICLYFLFLFNVGKRNEDYLSAKGRSFFIKAFLGRFDYSSLKKFSSSIDSQGSEVSMHEAKLICPVSVLIKSGSEHSDK